MYDDMPFERLSQRIEELESELARLKGEEEALRNRRSSGLIQGDSGLLRQQAQAPGSSGDGSMAVNGAGSVQARHDCHNGGRPLPESETTYRRLIESVLDGIIIVQHGRIEYFNPKTTQILGCCEEDLCGRSFMEFLHPEEVGRVREFHEQRLHGREAPDNYEVRIIDGSGRTRWLEASVAIIEWNGQPAGLSLLRDITEQVLAKQKLEHSEERYRRLFESSVLGIFRSSLDGRFQDVNPAFARLFGYSGPDEVLRLVQDIEQDIYLYPGQRERILQHLLKEGTAWREQTSFARKDGSTFQATLNIWPVYDDAARLIYLEGFIEDITELKRAEAELRRSEERYRRLFEDAVLGIFRSNFDGQLVQVNPAFAAMFGYESPAEMMELVSDFGEQHYLNPALRKDITAQVLQQGGPLHIENEYVRRDGRSFVGNLHCWPVYEGLGSPLCLEGFVEDISERKERERELQLLSSMVEQSSAAIMRTDLQGRIDYVNQAFEDLYGWLLCEIRGHQTDFLNAEEDAERIQAEILNTVGAGRTYRGELRNWRKDGSQMIIQVEVNPIWGQDGSIIAYMGSQIDVTERKQAEESLRKREEEYRLLVENQTDLVVKVDREGRFQFVSPSYLKLFGKREEELLGESFVPLIHQDDRESTQQAMQNLYRPPYSAILEQRAMTQYGWRWLEWVDTAIRDGQGRVSAIIGVGRDVTDRKRMEKDLERERIMLNSLMESMPAWMVLVDQDCHIRYCNQNFRDRFGFTTGTTCYQTLYGLERQCSGCSMDFRLNVAKSHEATLSDGRIYELSSLPFQDADGSPLLLEIGIDVTEKKALEAEAVRNHQLALLGQLAAGVAHEVNNPINGIINYAEMLKDLMAELGQASEVPDRIIKEGDRIADIVSSLLSFARVQTEDKQPVSVSEIIQETLSLIQGQLRKECIEVVQNIEANLPQVVANNQQIEQVLLNLFSNARHALQSKDPNGGNGKRIEISCRTADDGRMVRTRVLDNGVGMAGEVLQNIYTPFFSTKAAGQGTGLGMSIIFGIIKDHGGQIEIDSRQGEYTLIEFDLPTVQAKREKKV